MHIEDSNESYCTVVVCSCLKGEDTNEPSWSVCHTCVRAKSVTVKTIHLKMSFCHCGGIEQQVEPRRASHGNESRRQPVGLVGSACKTLKRRWAVTVAKTCCDFQAVLLFSVNIGPLKPIFPTQEQLQWTKCIIEERENNFFLNTLRTLCTFLRNRAASLCPCVLLFV